MTVVWKEFLQWNSPIPYIFGGLAVVFGITSAVLFILACSHQIWMRNSINNDKEKASKNKGSEQFDTTPSIAVIMAGDDHPKYMAKPVSFVKN
ncbi:hypothetical protein Csa_013545 [Cucumis sativus]|uniref:Uncharacterized protein n=1 Tax=Cucumis sativus TaxID=3659 RepID=A0A0A0LRW3_CUCSA|nr:hypothetical protein Csa_013545 [Cucumis sativus]